MSEPDLSKFSADEQKQLLEMQERLKQRRQTTVITTEGKSARSNRQAKQVAAAVTSELANIELKITAANVEDVMKAQEDYERDQRARKIAGLWHKSNVPELHRVAREWDQASQWFKTMSGIREKISVGFCYALLGPRGNGKTQIGVELIRANCSLTRSALYETTIRVYINLKATFGKNSRQTEADVIDMYTAPQLLVLDDYGRRGEGVHEENIFFEILDTRYRRRRDTIICSNETRDVFETKAGESLISRINERGGIIECNWPSFRDQQPQI